MEVVIGALILWVLPIFIANSMGKTKHRAGLLWGLLLGWLGVLCLAVLPPVQTSEEKELARLEQQLRVKALEEQLKG
jgi:hypothetical protein